MNKKNSNSTGITFGAVTSVVFILQGLLTSDNRDTKHIVIIIASGLLGGVLAGFLFGWIMGRFAKSKLFTKGTEIETDPGENILFETGANHFRGIEAVGGKLYVTNKRLVFRSHKFNIPNHHLTIGLADIEEIERYKTLGLVNNGLSIQCANGSTEKFVVQQPEEWFNILTNKNGSQQKFLQSHD